MRRRTVVALFAGVLGGGFIMGLASSAGVAVAEPLLTGGLYETTYRLELPHVERWAIDKTAVVCVAPDPPTGALPLPVLSSNHPFAACAARDVRRDGDLLRFRIACPGRDAARAQAVYRITQGGFEGRIDMVMGAKNMTMREVQSGRRIGSCDVAAVSTPWRVE